MVQHRPNKHDCTVHTTDVLHRLGLLVPCIAGEDLRPVGAAELADWIDVELEAEPEIAGTAENGDGGTLIVRHRRASAAAIW